MSNITTFEIKGDLWKHDEIIDGNYNENMGPIHGNISFILCIETYDNSIQWICNEKSLQWIRNEKFTPMTICNKKFPTMNL